ncbi:OX-2 membrane glycoprotein-like [Rhinatrema bivittatum]|uniref:OX-2 membrane glycoprotein-like n=2 Tax=Rhinatrema bivittatum TaxID=194408 RepID=UPI00112D445C|nr:OX-2 membrane glycoprotein-like [Rhinatrema bivittatum]
MCDLGTTLQSAALLAMLCALSFTEPLPGSNVAVRYKHSLTAVTGQNVTLQCEFMLQFEVLQLTWQKIKGFTSENVATYSKKYGVKVLGAFSKRVHIEGIRTSMTSFSLQAVKLEDEACYICIFNAYPHGFYSGKTCLHVQTLAEVSALHSDQSTDGFILANCTATGKPTPEINWKPETALIGPPQESRTQNADGTVTVTSTCNFSAESLQSLSCVIIHPVQSKELLVFQYPEGRAIDGEIRHHHWGIISMPVLIVCIFVWIWTRKLRKSEIPSVPSIPELKIPIKTQQGDAPNILVEDGPSRPDERELRYQTLGEASQKTPCKTNPQTEKTHVGTPGTKVKQRKIDQKPEDGKKKVSRCIFENEDMHETEKITSG